MSWYLKKERDIHRNVLKKWVAYNNHLRKNED